MRHAPVVGVTDEADWDDTLSEAEEPPKRHLVVVPASEMKMRSARWLYDWRIPSDGISLLAGREGIGKSTIAFDIVAKATRGTLPGRFFGTPRSVVVVASEDSWESVILPRLTAAGADMARVFRVDARNEGNQLEPISVPADLVELGQLVVERDVAMLLLDPVMSIISGTLDTHKDRDVRRALDPLARFCATYEVAALGLIHVNKSGTSDPLNSVMASRAFTAVARSVLYCMTDPEAEHEDRYLFGHPKSNLGPKQPTLKYHLIQVSLPIPDAEDPRDAIVTTSRVVWDGEDGRSIREVMEGISGQGRPKGELNHRILDWLKRRGFAASGADIAAEFPDVPRNTLNQNLARMVARGELSRPSRGLYALPVVSDGVSDTSLVSSETSSLSLASPTQGQLTEMTEVTLSPTSLEVSLAPGYCRDCGWELDSNGHHANCRSAA